MDEEQFSKLMGTLDARFCVLLDALAAIKHEIVELQTQIHRYKKEFENYY